MRSLLLLIVVLWGLSKVFAQPYIGTYLWTWVSLMNPHRLTWGITNSLPLALIIGAVTAIGLITGKQAKLSVWSRESIVLALLIVWVCITTLFAVNQTGALQELDRFLKIQIFIFLILVLISDKKKLDGLIWVMALSIGFYGIKGGIFTIVTGGSARVWGPEGSFIGGNNEIALALLMTMPLFRYLQLQATNVWIKRGLGIAMLLCAASILGSQSRGALLGILSVAAFFWWKSPYKLSSTVFVGIIGAMILLFMPQTWWDRMNTIQNYEEDGSAMGRINAWVVAYRTANNSFTGGGANMFTPEMFMRYAPAPEDIHDVHSIYFEMIGEQGWVGFSLFMLLAFFTWRTCSQLINENKNNPETKWAADLAAMLQVCLIGYYSAGAFLGLAYFDYYYDLIATAIIAKKLTDHAKQAKTNPQPQNRQRNGIHP